MRLTDRIRACTRCEELAATRTQVVLGEGPIPCPIVFLGEAPGAKEDELGKPFVGASGAILRAKAFKAGLREGDYHILNTLKCRPPDNRDPTVEEMNNCKEFLILQLQAVKPKVIVALGKYAQAFLLRTNPTVLRVTKNAGKVVQYDTEDHLGMTWKGLPDIKLLMSFHPAYVMRNRGTDIDRAFVGHLKLARKLAKRR